MRALLSSFAEKYCLVLVVRSDLQKPAMHVEAKAMPLRGAESQCAANAARAENSMSALGLTRERQALWQETGRRPFRRSAGYLGDDVS